MKKIILSIMPVFDVVFAPFVFLGTILFKLIRRIGMRRLPFCKRIMMLVGIFPIRDHYYDPLFQTKHLRYSMSQDRCLPGINFNISAQLLLLESFHYQDELKTFSVIDGGAETKKYYYGNGSYGAVDADFLYSMIRHFQPKHIVEIGSGFSTLVAIEAVKKNYEESKGYTCTHECIEPYEKPWLEKMPPQIIRKKLEDVDVEIFEKLNENDILIIDSSHMIRPQGDVLVEYLEILPTLHKGVLVHIHDIFTPKDYREDWLSEDVRLWNEQYLLEAFLSNNDNFEVLAGVNYLYHHHREKMEEKIPIIKEILGLEPGAFWIKKVK